MNSTEWNAICGEFFSVHVAFSPNVIIDTIKFVKKSILKLALSFWRGSNLRIIQLQFIAKWISGVAVAEKIMTLSKWSPDEEAIGKVPRFFILL